MSREMKDSGIDWIGTIPEHWEIGKIGDVYNVRTGNNQHVKFSKSGDRLFTFENITEFGTDPSSEKYTKLTDLCKQLSEVHDGDVVVIALSTRIGTVCVYREEIGRCYASGGIIICRAKANDNASFLRFWIILLANTGYFKAVSTGGIIRRVSGRQMLNAPMLIVPLDEQNKIASFLETKHEQINKTKQKKNDLLEKLTKYKQTLISQTVLTGLDFGVRMKESEIDWIREIPEHWEIESSGNLFTLSVEKNIDPNVTILSTTRDYGLIPQEEYKKIAVNHVASVNKENYDKLRVIHKGDFCLGMMSYRNGIDYSDYDGAVSKMYRVFRVSSDKMNEKYYKYLFKSNKFIAKLGSCTSDARKGKVISYKQFEQISLCVPPVEEQKRIADFLDKKCEAIDGVIKKTKESIKKLNEYKATMIYQVMTGKMDV